MSHLSRWSPMIAPPLPCRNDGEVGTCEHAYPRELCRGTWHELDPIELKLRHIYGAVLYSPPKMTVVKHS